MSSTLLKYLYAAVLLFFLVPVVWFVVSVAAAIVWHFFAGWWIWLLQWIMTLWM